MDLLKEAIEKEYQANQEKLKKAKNTGISKTKPSKDGNPQGRNKFKLTVVLGQQNKYQFKLRLV